MNIAIIGAQWGDEGKGKIVDLLTEHFSIVARYQGGHNAGHTVIINGKQFILHLIPSGILHAGVTCLIGNGVVVDPCSLFTELDALKAEGIRSENRLFVSDRAHVILPYHRDLERFAENNRGDRKIGTTLRGIGPSYEHKLGRLGVRIGDLSDSRKDGFLAETIKRNVAARNQIIHDTPLDWTVVYSDLLSTWTRLSPMVKDVSEYLDFALKEGKRILFEGAQGTMLDVDHGTYPYVSSSNGTVGGICTGLGVSPRAVEGVLGVVKAYTTRVGEGPFPTELSGKAGDELRELGQEYGASTARPRRCGWYDAVVARYASRINGLETFALTKLDILDGLKEIKLCTSYRYKGKTLNSFPANPAILSACTPNYETFPGWSRPTAGLREFEDLPDEAKTYIKRIEQVTSVPISIISTGSDREETIILKDSIARGWLE